MIQSTINNNLIENQHRIVKLQYFENLVRYYRFFQLYPQYVENVVVSDQSNFNKNLNLVLSALVSD